MPPRFEGSRVLLLQGPNGPFFRRFAAELRRGGAEVTKVNFNAGDALFYRGRDAVRFRHPMDEWPAFFRALVAERQIDAVYLFGDCRPMHRQAVAIARELGIPVWVFEEGYLRPDHVTMERGGVNGNSSMPKDPDVYRRETAGLPELPPPRRVGNTFYHHAWYAALHAIAVTVLFWRYRHYRHHRNVNAFVQAAVWVRGMFRKLWYKLRERNVMGRLCGEYDGRYYFVPLQVHCDAQLQHSDYPSMEAFIDEVVASFATNAPAATLLVFKHHPHDRAYRDYGRHLREAGERHGCGDRVVYVHDLHLPTLLKHARGTITMNSTVGTSSLYHDTPVIVLGRAVYDVPGLTHQGPLAEFFVDPGEVDTELFDVFCRWLREHNQINGSFYRRIPGTTSLTGLALRPPSDEAPAPISGSWPRPESKSA